MGGFLRAPIDRERRAGLAVQVAMRWLLAGATLFVIDVRAGTAPVALVIMNLLVFGAVGWNAALYLRLRRERPIRGALPVVATVYDAAAITAAIALVDGFDNDSYVLYYPALLAFCVVYPGRLSLAYSAAIAVAYVVVSLTAHAAFDPALVADQKRLLIRLTTLAATVLIANMTVRIERKRRVRAVAAEAERAVQAREFERRALAAERAMMAERQRLSQEVHDGISQGVYMLTLGLETAHDMAERDPARAADAERLAPLVRLAKQTLLETRNLLFDLGGVMAGRQSLTALARHHAAEFSAVTGITVEVRVAGAERPLPSGAVAEIYRVLQEGLANVYKHARATAVTLDLHFNDDGVRLELADNGRGFARDGVTARGHGLHNMRARAERLGGSIKVASAPGEGSRLSVTIPYAEAAHDPGAGAAG